MLGVGCADGSRREYNLPLSVIESTLNTGLNGRHGHDRGGSFAATSSRPHGPLLVSPDRRGPFYVAQALPLTDYRAFKIF